jgi:pseudouridine-5'-phosphate glycosidase
MMSKENSLPEILDLFDSWLNVSNLQFDRKSREGSVTYIINHGLGRKWSLFLEKVFEYIVKDLGITGASFNIIDGTVTMKINLKNR